MSGRKPLQLIGKTFGRLTVIDQAENKNGFTYWKCRCSCGNIVTIKGVNLKIGKTKSCGCLNRDVVIQRNKDNADGKYRNSRLYRIYYGMRTRCYNKDDIGYKAYGSRGITICDEWLNDFLVFQDWALKNGYQDNLSIDRINNDGNYEPSNCRWVDGKTQSNNRRSNRIIEYNGEERTVAEWSALTGIGRNIIYSRLREGWSVKDAITIPVGKYHGGVQHSHLD